MVSTANWECKMADLDCCNIGLSIKYNSRMHLSNKKNLKAGKWHFVKYSKMLENHSIKHNFKFITISLILLPKLKHQTYFKNVYKYHLSGCH